MNVKKSVIRIFLCDFKLQLWRIPQPFASDCYSIFAIVTVLQHCFGNQKVFPCFIVGTHSVKQLFVALLMNEIPQHVYVRFISGWKIMKKEIDEWIDKW